MQSHETQPQTASHDKKPYGSPRLVVYGDLRRLTTAPGPGAPGPGAKGGLMVDAPMGRPNTRL